MKTVLALALMLASSAASARSIQLEQICGQLKVEQRLCITTPCDQGLELVTGDGRPTILTATGAERELLEGKDGAELCVNGLHRTSQGVFEVIYVPEQQ